jgi:hypothetical protein
MTQKKNFWFFLILLLSSPWFLLIAKNNKLIFSQKFVFFQPFNQAVIEEINTERGMVEEKKLNFLGKLIINKGTWMGKSILTYGLESYDFHYLFFEGDLDLLKSTKSSGALYLSLLPLIIFGFFLYFKGKVYWPGLILLLPLLGAISFQHYETLSRIPFLIGLTWVAAYGLSKFCSSSKMVIKIMFFIFYVYELTRFLHYIYFHYSIYV